MSKKKKNGDENKVSKLVLITATTNLLIALINLIKELIKLLN